MLQIKNIEKRYVTGDLTQTALAGVSVNFRDSEFVAILGPSGSGKTTLLNIIGGLDKYDSGDLIINGISTKKYTDRDWDSYRNHTIGFIFQSYNLIPHQTVLANVELAMTISGISKVERRTRAKAALVKVGLGNQMHKKPSQMSGGQMQRVAIARALANDPDILLADEPTGALDSETSVQIMDLLAEVAKDKLVIMVTHNPELAQQYATRIVRVKDGEIQGDTNPYEIDTSRLEKAVHKNMGKSSMSPLTSLSLSFNNLKTKKARTFITAFAGSIGIIGIALILSLSNGVNTYIDTIQKDAMLSYPIQIDKQSYDMTSIMESMRSKSTELEEGLDDIKTDAVYINSTGVEIKSLFKTKENNLERFKTYLDNPECDLLQYVGDNGIIYSYEPKFQIFTYDADGKFMNTDGSELSSTGSMRSPFSALMGGNSSNVCAEEMMKGQNGDLISHVITDNYEIVYGRMPSAYNEVVLVADLDNTIQMNTLFQLGLLPLSEYDDIQEQLSNGEEVVIDKNRKISYDTICNKDYYLIPQCDFYIENEETESETESETEDADKKEEEKEKYRDISNDKDEIQDKLLKDAIKIKVVGVIKLNEDSDAVFLTQPLGYTRALTDYLIEYTNNSEIVKKQKADSKINVLNGLEFESASRNEKRRLARDYIDDLETSDKAMLYQSLLMFGQIKDKDNNEEETTENSTEVKSLSNEIFNIFNTKTVYAEDILNTGLEIVDSEGVTEELVTEIIEETESLDKPTYLNYYEGEVIEESETVETASMRTEDAIITEESESVSSIEETEELINETEVLESNTEVAESATINNGSKVIDNVIIHLSVTKAPDKTVYKSGEELDLSGGIVREIEIIKYSDNTYDYFDEYREMSDSSYVIDSSLYNKDKWGIYPVTVTKYYLDEATGKEYSDKVRVYTYVGAPEKEKTLFGLTPEQLEEYAQALREGLIGEKDETGQATLFGITPERLEAYAKALREGLIGDGIAINPKLSIEFGLGDMSQLFNALSSSGLTDMSSLFSGATGGMDLSSLMSGIAGGSGNAGGLDLSSLLSGGGTAGSGITPDMLAGLMSSGMASGSGTTGGLDMSSLLGASGLSEDQIKAMMGGNSSMGNLTEEQMKAMMSGTGSMTEEQMKAIMGGSTGMGSLSEEQLKEMMGNSGMGDMSNMLTDGEFDYSKMLEMYTGESSEALAEKLDDYMKNPSDDVLLYIYDTYIASGTYEDNLDMFGVVDLNKPSSISIYADSFESKDSISKCIKDYNEEVGNEEDQITYTDYVALLMSSITTIINAISYVLIAFVAVSLVVSSIMIGIITYISVLERTKEIGILRAIGASKRNISQVFNAETFIIGLFSGVLGIVTTELLIIPINIIIHIATEMDNINAILPITGAIVLIILSVFLTLIGGFIPAKKAAKKDPVLALRTD